MTSSTGYESRPTSRRTARAPFTPTRKDVESLAGLDKDGRGIAFSRPLTSGYAGNYAPWQLPTSGPERQIASPARTYAGPDPQIQQNARAMADPGVPQNSKTYSAQPDDR